MLRTMRAKASLFGGFPGDGRYARCVSPQCRWTMWSPMTAIGISALFSGCPLSRHSMALVRIAGNRRTSHLAASALIIHGQPCALSRPLSEHLPSLRCSSRLMRKPGSPRATGFSPSDWPDLNRRPFDPQSGSGPLGSDEGQVSGFLVNQAGSGGFVSR